MPRMTAPADAMSVSLSMPSGPVVVDGPEADVPDDVALELAALGWTETKTTAKRGSSK